MRTGRSTRTAAGRVVVVASVAAGLLLVGCTASNEVTASRRSEQRPATDDGTSSSEEFLEELPSGGSVPDVPGLGEDVPCPTGELSVEVTSIDATDEFDTGTWMVELSGTLENGTDAPVSGVFVDVRVDGAMDAMGFTDDFEVAAGATTTWTATTMVLDGPEPTEAEAIIESWMWSDFDHFECPTN